MVLLQTTQEIKVRVIEALLWGEINNIDPLGYEEIGAVFGLTRQAVHDFYKRNKQQNKQQ